MNPPLSPKARLNPTAAHSTLTMAMEMKFSISMSSTFFVRTMPP